MIEGLNRKLGEVYAAYGTNGKYCAGAYFLFSMDRFIFLFSASSRESRENGAMFLLIDNFIKELFNQNEKIVPIMIGGDHFCTYPMVRAVADQIKKKEEFGILIFDAHLDFYQEWDKGVYSHATISHRIYDLEYVNNKNLLIVGTRDIDIEEFNLASSENIKYLNAYHIIDGLDYYIDSIKEFFKKSNIKSLYVSIDIDALDPSIAPGTGYAIPGGFSYRDIWKILKEITENFNIVGFDLVEVAPNLDLENKMTCILAAKLIVEVMYFIRSNNL